MSVYDRRYNVSADMISYYTDDPREALTYYDGGMAAFQSGKARHAPWANEGSAYHEEIYAGHRDFRGIEGTMVTRGPTTPLTRTALLARVADYEYKQQRRAVEIMIKELTR